MWIPNPSDWPKEFWQWMFLSESPPYNKPSLSESPLHNKPSLLESPHHNKPSLLEFPTHNKPSVRIPTPQ